jgi:hypothetical protein
MVIVSSQSKQSSKVALKAHSGGMCLMQTPYYHVCGHYGAPAIAPHGRCARAEGISGACWEEKHIGIETVEETCGNCRRIATDATIDGNSSSTGPVDINKFNELVKLHKETCDLRYCSRFLAPVQITNTKYSASEASQPSDHPRPKP